jgi:hypothetical protein
LLFGLVFFVSFPTFAQTPLRGPIVVVFEDGGQVEVSDWMFRYSWNVYSGAFYTPASLKSTDLLIELSRTIERGVTLTEERTIPAAALASIKYDIERSKPNSARIRSATITLASGEVIKAANITPSPKLLTQGREEVQNHHLYLIGKATLRGQAGTFDMALDQYLQDPNNTIAEVRFSQK